MFKSKNKSTSTHTRENKWRMEKVCNHKKTTNQEKRFYVVKEHKLEKWKVVRSESRSTLFQSDGPHQDKKRSRWSDTPVMPGVCCVSWWGQCHDLGLIQLGRPRFSFIRWLKHEVSWLPECTEWPGFFMNGFFFLHSWWHWHSPRWQWQNSLGSNWTQWVKGAWDILFTHGLIHSILHSPDRNPTED